MEKEGRGREVKEGMWRKDGESSGEEMKRDRKGSVIRGRGKER